MRERLAESKESDAYSARRADAFSRELTVARTNLAASQKRVKAAERRVRAERDPQRDKDFFPADAPAECSVRCVG